MSGKRQPSGGGSKLREILTAAIASGADAIELERDSDGCLEVIVLRGNCGGGFALSRSGGQELIESISEKMRASHRKKFRLPINGKDYMVHVKTYEHFGENAYRLTWGEAKH